MTGFSLRAREAAAPASVPPIDAFARRAREVRFSDDLLTDLVSATPATQDAPVRGLALRAPKARRVVRRTPPVELWRLGAVAQTATLAVALVAGATAASPALAEQPSGAAEPASASSSATSVGPTQAGAPDLLVLVIGRTLHVVLDDGQAVIGEAIHADADVLVLATEPLGVVRTLPRTSVREVRVLGRRRVEDPEARSAAGRGAGPSGQALIRAGTAMTIPGGVLLGATIAAAAISLELVYYGAGHVLALAGPMLGVGIPLVIIGRDMKKRERAPSLVVQARPDGAVRLTVAGRF